MKLLKGSKTEANLIAAYAGESQARNNYTFFAAKASQDGYEQIARIFTETANNEKEHAEIWFKLLQSGMPDTCDNLKSAAEGEQYEHESMYPQYAWSCSVLHCRSQKFLPGNLQLPALQYR